MPLYRVINASKQITIATQARLANNFFSRLRGLLFTSTLEEGQALLIVPCRSIHSIGMSYSIDAIFLNKEFKVVGLLPNFIPQKLSKVYWQAHSCLELPTGSITKSSTTFGDQIVLEELKS